MKATGVVRRIDELGRVVIPKEIRRTLKIKEGTPLEIYSGDNGELVLKKYSPILEISDFADEVAETMFASTHYNILITNLEKIISSSKLIKSAYLGKNIDSAIEKIINSRMPKIFNSGEIHTLFFADNPNVVSYAICPITEAGDVYGSIIIFKELEQVSESSFLLAKTFADFLGKQVG